MFLCVCVLFWSILGSLDYVFTPSVNKYSLVAITGADIVLGTEDAEMNKTMFFPK